MDGYRVETSVTIYRVNEHGGYTNDRFSVTDARTMESATLTDIGTVFTSLDTFLRELNERIINRQTQGQD